MITLLLVATICTTALAAPQLVSSSFVANSFASADGTSSLPRFRLAII